MSMSTHAIGLISKDNPEYQKHVEIVAFCKKMKVSLPQETADYFDLSTEADTSYWDVYIDQKRQKEIPVRSYGAAEAQGYEIDIKDIPPDIETIRFYNSW